MKFLRYHNKEAVHFVTNRCEHEMFLLLPTKQINALILFWLAKAKTKYGSEIELFAFIFMSNHFHLLLRDTKGQLPQFMGYFQGNLAKSINILLGRKGKFWFREYDDVIVDGENEFWNRYAYTVLNPVKSGLVASAAQWQGVNSLQFQLENKAVEITGINRSEFNEAKRFGRKADPKDFQETYRFKISKSPMLQHRPRSRQIDFIKDLVKNVTNTYKKNRLYKPALGMKKILSQKPTDRPKRSTNKPRFKFFCMNRERLNELKETYKQFVGRYRECMNLLFQRTQSVMRTNLNRTNPICWPEGSYPPTCHLPFTNS